MESPTRMRGLKTSNPNDLEKRLLSLGALRVEVRSDAEVDRARQQGRALAKQMGCSAFDATLIATVVSELARTIVATARRGKIVLGGKRKNTSAEISILARITDTAHAVQHGSPTGGALGLRLRAAQRIMDEFEIVSHPARGTTVVAKKCVPVPDMFYKRVGALNSAGDRSVNRSSVSPRWVRGAPCLSSANPG